MKKLKKIREKIYGDLIKKPYYDNQHKNKLIYDSLKELQEETIKLIKQGDE